MTPPRVTVCALLYGDHVDLAKRCLDPLEELGDLAEVRVYANSPGESTRRYLREWSSFMSVPPGSAVRGRGVAGWNQGNKFKYPVMRKLFHGGGAASGWWTGLPPVTTDWVAWFDDDSYIDSPTPRTCLEGALDVADGKNADVLGSVWSVNYRAYSPGMRGWIMDHCPWWNGRPIPDTVQFARGGWWLARTEVLRKYDWPHPDLVHRGGDVLLGELCRQRGLRLVNYFPGVKINADLAGRDDKSPRRGVTDHRPIGYDYRRAEECRT